MDKELILKGSTNDTWELCKMSFSVTLKHLLTKDINTYKIVNMVDDFLNKADTENIWAAEMRNYWTYLNKEWFLISLNRTIQ